MTPNPVDKRGGKMPKYAGNAGAWNFSIHIPRCGAGHEQALYNPTLLVLSRLHDDRDRLGRACQSQRLSGGCEIGHVPQHGRIDLAPLVLKALV